MDFKLKNGIIKLNQYIDKMKTNKKRIRMLRLKRSTPKIIHEISGFVMANNLNNFSSLAKCRMLGYKLIKKTKCLGKNNWGEQRKIIAEFSYWDDNNYPENEVPNNDLKASLSNFRDEFLIVIDHEYDKSIDWKKYRLVRQVSPPLSAYKYEAFCKLDIKATGRDYGLLFES